MTFDVAVVGSPSLDLTFEGLPHLPVPGEEVTGTGLHVAPGGTGMQAVGAARLELRATLMSPRGTDPAGQILAGLFEAEGVAWRGPPASRTAVTTILIAGSAPAMTTFHPSDEVGPKDLASVDADAMVLSLGRLRLRPSGAAAYVITGPGEVGRFDHSDLGTLDGARAVLMNEGEARSFTGTEDSTSAARVLAEHAVTAVVTRGPEGAVGVEAGETAEVPAPEVDVIDATGAGDLFIAAYLWAERSGFHLEARLRWACLYASLSTMEPTALAGALRLEEFLAEGERRGLPAR